MIASLHPIFHPVKKRIPIIMKTVDVIEMMTKIAEQLRSSCQVELVKEVIDFLDSIFSTSEQVPEYHDRFLEQFQSEFTELFDSYVIDDNEDIASNAAFFLSERIDPFDTQ